MCSSSTIGYDLLQHLDVLSMLRALDRIGSCFLILDLFEMMHDAFLLR